MLQKYKKNDAESRNHIWVPSIGVGGIKFYKGNLFPEWENSLLIGSLKFQYLSILERDGFIRRDPEVSRGIELLDGFAFDGNRLRIPLLGIVAAGDPIPVPSQDSWVFTDTIELPEPFLSSGYSQDLYALRVKGLSMIDALVADGDVVIVDAKSALKDGDMIVGWLKTENEVTLKKMYVEESHVRLQPANPLMDPIFVDYGNLEVQGKVVGVLRNIV